MEKLVYPYLIVTTLPTNTPENIIHSTWLYHPPPPPVIWQVTFPEPSRNGIYCHCHWLKWKSRTVFQPNHKTFVIVAVQYNLFKFVTVGLISNCYLTFPQSNNNSNNCQWQNMIIKRYNLLSLAFNNPRNKTTST